MRCRVIGDISLDRVLALERFITPTFLDTLAATNAGIVIEAEGRGTIPTLMATSPRGIRPLRRVLQTRTRPLPPAHGKIEE
ncbi:hypothetical protein GGD56_003687 [Rhizobium mongolense]|uniref:Uncharacterized protein n=1 Tax=Rhizobium mongolense TaxID=57676 RepID=A0ABR6IPM7_9HYPH|nr:hypothetical protein [Rhizobium mongolense]